MMAHVPRTVAIALVLASAARCSGGPMPGDVVDIDATNRIDALMYDAPVSDGSNTVDASDGATCLPSSFLPAPPAAFTSTTDTPLSIQVSASGEALAEAGYDFTTHPSAGQTVFVDGWQLRFDTYLVVFDHIRINRPGNDTTMQNVVGGLVAQHDGPLIVNVHARGSIAGAGGPPETAQPLFVFESGAGGTAFDPTVRYAFSFETVPASCEMHNVNLGSADLRDAQTMITHHWTKFFRGTATYLRDPAMDAPTFQSYPRVVHFAFGMSDPAAYLNCQNPDLGSAETDRGVQPSTSGHVRAQITMHTDHFFWDETNVEGTPLHFDPLAARALGFGTMPGATHELTLDQLAGENPSALTDALGNLVPDRGDRSLEASMMDTHPPPSYLVRSAASTVVHDYRDMAAYNARGQGHLNSNGLCFVQPTGPIAY